MNAEYFRGVLNSLHDQGLDLNILEVRVLCMEDHKFSTANGRVHVNVSEDGESGTLTLEIE